jgi:hypothetical protein
MRSISPGTRAVWRSPLDPLKADVSVSKIEDGQGVADITNQKVHSLFVKQRLPV